MHLLYHIKCDIALWIFRKGMYSKEIYGISIFYQTSSLAIYILTIFDHSEILPFKKLVQPSSVQSLSWVQLFATLRTAACQASLSITNSRSLLKLMPIESVMRSNHLILYDPLLLPPSIFPSIKLFSKELNSSHHKTKELEFQLQHQSFQ